VGVFTVDVQRRGVRHRIELVTQQSSSYERGIPTAVTCYPTGVFTAREEACVTATEGTGECVALTDAGTAVSLLATIVCPATTDEPIEMSFESRASVGPRSDVLDD